MKLGDRLKELRGKRTLKEMAGLTGTDFARGEDTPDFTFTVPIDDGSGRVAKCWQATSQEYLNCEFSTGLVFDLPPEDVYVCLRRDGKEPSYWFLRRDEAEALVWVISGALWALTMNPNADVTELFGEGKKHNDNNLKDSQKTPDDIVD